MHSGRRIILSRKCKDTARAGPGAAQCLSFPRTRLTLPEQGVCARIRSRVVLVPVLPPLPLLLVRAPAFLRECNRKPTPVQRSCCRAKPRKGYSTTQETSVTSPGTLGSSISDTAWTCAFLGGPQVPICPVPSRRF
jgi:hypothetical protein